MTRTRRTVKQTLAFGVMGMTIVVIRRSRRPLGIGRNVRHARGRLAGIGYRLRGGHPDEHVDDLVLADRIRSTIGPVEHALDQPRINVAVYRQMATLHGDVATDFAAERLVQAVVAVSGVVAVRSRLHVGLLPGDACPSAARECRSQGLHHRGRPPEP